MKLSYLDTSALMRWAEGQSPSTSERNKKIAPFMDVMFADSERSLACSELTLLEFHSNLSDRLRDTAQVHYSDSWWQDARDGVMDRVAERRIEVIPTPPRAFEQVMVLISTATTQFGMKLRAWDALHATVALDWAHNASSPVEIVTSDADFKAVLKIPGLSAMLSVENLDIAASTGEGADRKA